jgi:hypothetical protein
MESKELSKILDEKAPPREKLKHITELDKIKVADIENVDVQTYEFTDGEKTRQVRRFILTIKGERILCPSIVMTQLNVLLKKFKVTSFVVLKSGTGINTTYNVIPEAQI